MSGYWETFVTNNKHLWHFDPSVVSQDFTYLGRLKTDFKPLLDLMSDDKNFKEFIISEKNPEHSAELSYRINAFNEWGFNEHNTKSLQITDSEFPEIFEPYTKFPSFTDCKAVALKQYPGQFLPWHEDTYVGFRKEFNVVDNTEVTRYSIFLEDWNWGHFFGAGTNVIHQWKQGDIIEIKPSMPHTSCNAGMAPKLTMTITGTVNEESLRKKEAGIFEY